MLDYIVSAGANINFSKTSFSTSTIVDGNSIRYNPNEIYTGIDSFGNSFTVSEIYVLTHELNHLFYGIDDPAFPDIYQNTSLYEDRGVVESNAIEILSQLGFSQFRAGYYASDNSEILPAGVEFTGGASVDHVIVAKDGNPATLTSAAGNSRDLPIGDGSLDQTFNSGGGGDFVYAGGGNDQVDGGAGNDWLDGGTGDDVAVYDTIRNFVSITRMSPSATPLGIVSDGHAITQVQLERSDTLETDLLRNFETISLGDGPQHLLIKASVDGSSTTDPLTIDGGSGSDVLDFSQFGGGVDSDASGAVAGAGIRAVNFETIVGSEYGDVLVTDSASTIYAGGGDDVLTGGAAYAVLFGGDGNDTLTAGAGGALLDGGNSSEGPEGEASTTYTGGSGADTFVIGPSSSGTGRYVINATDSSDHIVVRSAFATGTDADSTTFDTASWQTGVELKGGSAYGWPGEAWAAAEMDQTPMTPNITVGSDGAYVFSFADNGIVNSAALGTLYVYYEFDRDAAILNIDLYGGPDQDASASVTVHDFQEGDLGLSFPLRPKGLIAWEQGEGSEAIVRASWDAVNETMAQVVAEHVPSALQSPAPPHFDLGCGLIEANA